MEALCLKCGAQLDALWMYCPHCGLAFLKKPAGAAPPVKAATETEGARAERAPARGAFAGLVFGMLAVPVLAIVGAMLCLTGLGAILGVPMIVAAVLAPLLGPMIGIGALHGTCPWCGVRIHSIVAVPEFYCHGCGKAILIEKRKFLKAAH